MMICSPILLPHRQWLAGKSAAKKRMVASANASGIENASHARNQAYGGSGIGLPPRTTNFP